MPRGKCSGCNKRRVIVFDSSCEPCLRTTLTMKVRNANAPGASNEEKDACWAFMDRVYKAVGFQKHASPPADPQAQDLLKRPDTI